jgi:hypothetical protein
MSDTVYMAMAAQGCVTAEACKSWILKSTDRAAWDGESWANIGGHGFSDETPDAYEPYGGFQGPGTGATYNGIQQIYGIAADYRPTRDGNLIVGTSEGVFLYDAYADPTLSNPWALLNDHHGCPNTAYYAVSTHAQVPNKAFLSAYWHGIYELDLETHNCELIMDNYDDHEQFGKFWAPVALSEDASGQPHLLVGADHGYAPAVFQLRYDPDHGTLTREDWSIVYQPRSVLIDEAEDPLWWSQISGASIRQFAVDPTDPTHVVIAMMGAPYYSTHAKSRIVTSWDGGATFHIDAELEADLPVLALNGLLFNQTGDRLYALSCSSLYRMDLMTLAD